MIMEWLKRLFGTSDPPQEYRVGTRVPITHKRPPVRVTWAKSKKPENP